MVVLVVVGLVDAILQAVTDMGFTAPSEVQEKAIPVLLREETDVVALAQTAPPGHQSNQSGIPGAEACILHCQRSSLSGKNKGV